MWCDIKLYDSIFHKKSDTYSLVIVNLLKNHSLGSTGICNATRQFPIFDAIIFRNEKLFCD